ncbi:ABC transporter ATP-binding protein [Asticcacaulis machinosus]|uniref:ABC transporter ATP-binding protein n=1 Tax=Asticcacaulis machinosus TaxID=2984211 RepID=A0ABT5HFD6_9CAUL|nr:ABC transporter ATP-binding protein [Asticcacaulis machinosus]MDC7674723.1 ABC transporter ATP-binding protein [Asticcacaulis machinosus]
MIDIRNLDIDMGRSRVVSKLTARFETGRLHAIIGPNGAGKTSLLKAICGLLPSAAGTIRLAGHDLSALSLQERARLMAYLPQERTIAWDLKAIDIAALGCAGLSAEDSRRHAQQQLVVMGLSDKAENSVFSLSGGQRARVLLARLLATDAKIYCLDEPLTALDPAWQRRMLEVLKARAVQGCTVIVSIHDIGLAAQFADDLWVLDQGRLVAHGVPEVALSDDVLRQVFNITGMFTDGRHLRIDPKALPEHSA